MKLFLKFLVLVSMIFVMTIGCESYAFSMEGMEINSHHTSNFIANNGPIFSAVRLSGCDDFHCRKCKNRNHCTGRTDCNMPGCGHTHGLVLFSGGDLFFLRSSGGVKDDSGHTSCFSRAQQVAARLNHFMGMMSDHGNCRFFVLDSGKNKIVDRSSEPVIWFGMKSGHNLQKVVRVTRYDLAGYQYRSKDTGLSGMAKPSNKLTQLLVAQWWASLLNDYFSMIVRNEPPHLTTNTHCGQVLNELWKKVKTSTPNGKINIKSFSREIDNFNEEERSRLFIAAQIVPDAFVPDPIISDLRQ